MTDINRERFSTLVKFEVISTIETQLLVVEWDLCVKIRLQALFAKFMNRDLLTLGTIFITGMEK